MTPIHRSMLTGLALGATLLIASADAQRWRDRDHDDAGGRAAAGVAGLAVGAALVAGAHADRDQWYRDNHRDLAYDDGYYRDHGYYPNDGYYASRYHDYNGCTVQNRYDSYTGRPIQLRTCY